MIRLKKLVGKVNILNVGEALAGYLNQQDKWKAIEDPEKEQ